MQTRTVTRPLVPSTLPSAARDRGAASPLGSASSTTEARNQSTARALDTQLGAAGAAARATAHDTFELMSPASTAQPWTVPSRLPLSTSPALPKRPGQPDGSSAPTASSPATASASSPRGARGPGPALTGPRPTLDARPQADATSGSLLSGTKFAELDPSAGQDTATPGHAGRDLGARLSDNNQPSARELAGACVKGFISGAAGAALATASPAGAAAGVLTEGLAPATFIVGSGLVGCATGIAYKALDKTVDTAFAEPKASTPQTEPAAPPAPAPTPPATSMPGGDKLPDLLPGQSSLARDAMNRIIEQKTRSTDTWKVRPTDSAEAGGGQDAPPHRSTNGLVNPPSDALRDRSAAMAKVEARVTIGAQSVVNPVPAEASGRGRAVG
jgi:hypothetical protein